MSGPYIFRSGPNTLHMTPNLFLTCFQVNAYVSSRKWWFQVNMCFQVMFLSSLLPIFHSLKDLPPPYNAIKRPYIASIYCQYNHSWESWRTVYFKTFLWVIIILKGPFFFDFDLIFILDDCLFQRKTVYFSQEQCDQEWSRIWVGVQFFMLRRWYRI